jgi:hypothetical protein
VARWTAKTAVTLSYATPQSVSARFLRFHRDRRVSSWGSER